MNKSELVSAVAKESDLSNTQVEAALAGLETVLNKAVKDRDKVTLPGLLTVEAKHRDARTGRNPSTGEAIEIAASWVVKITAGSRLKAAAND